MIKFTYDEIDPDDPEADSRRAYAMQLREERRRLQPTCPHYFITVVELGRVFRCCLSCDAIERTPEVK